MNDGRVQIQIVLEHGVLSYVANVGNAEAIGVLEACKYNIIRNASGGVGRPPDERGAPASGGNRIPGLGVRKVG